MKEIIAGKSNASNEELEAYQKLNKLIKECPIPDKETIANLGLFHVRASFSRLLFMHRLYTLILNTHGIIMEFGVRWGQNMALFTTFRNIYEPYNISRRIIGFDTFSGFPSVSAEDGSSYTAKVGALDVTPNYESYLEELLIAHEKLGPRSNIKKHTIVKGDVIETLPKYFAKHPETIIALAYFDLDLFEPTKKCLELIRPYLIKNSIVGFDELGLDEFPGETQALKQAWGISNFEILRDPACAHQSYIIIGDTL
jgi:hypothetical protein